MDDFISLINEDNEADRFSTELYGWGRVTDLAREHGWEPAGTLEPGNWRDLDYNQSGAAQYVEDKGWDLPGAYDHNCTFLPDPTKTWSGGYFSEQGQMVTAEDAGALADALERATGGAPDDAGPTRRVIEIGPEYVGISRFSINEIVEMKAKKLLRYYEHAQEFLVFCRKGAFRIRCA